MQGLDFVQALVMITRRVEEAHWGLSEREYSAIPCKANFFSFSASLRCSISCAHSKTCSVDNENMRALRPVADFPKSGFWICDRCLRGQRKPPRLYATYATKVTLHPVPNTFFPARLRTKSISAQYSTSGALTSNNHLANRTASENSKANRRNFVIILVTLLSAGSVLAFSDTVKHSYAAATRSLRVLIALSQSVRE